MGNCSFFNGIVDSDGTIEIHDNGTILPLNFLSNYFVGPEKPHQLINFMHEQQWRNCLAV